MPEAIGKELKMCRIRNDLTMKNVAEKFGISIETLRRYENDSNGLSVERLEELLNYYKVEKSIFFENVCAEMHKTTTK